MANNVNIVPDDLSWEEVETKAALEKSGKTVYYAPIEIESREQLDSLGITWNQCRTWRIGMRPVIVHLTPCDEDTYNLLFRDLRNEYHREYRDTRCLVPGKKKPLIRCPESNRCNACPYGITEENRRANLISLDEMAENGPEEWLADPITAQNDTNLILEAALDTIGSKNSKSWYAVILKNYYGLSVSEIAKIMDDTERNVYYYLSEAKRIGKANQ